MQKRSTLHLFVRDEQAVSEEFTSLPALSVVMIGFSLFLLLLAQTYTAYETRVEHLQEYQTANQIMNTFLSPDSSFIRQGNLIDIPLVEADTTTIKQLCDDYQKSNIFFILRLHWDNITKDLPQSSFPKSSHRIALSKDIGMYLNEAQTVPGTLTIMLWRADS
jgi:hypothetical protein